MSERSALTIISFSGIDGAGKSTQISALKSHLQLAGFDPRLITFWDDVVVFRRFRERASLRAFGGDPGIGSPENPLNRRDKNIQSPLLNAIRCLLYLADALSVRGLVTEIRKTGTSIAIFDRYIYDELANLPSKGWFFRAFAGIVMKIIPRPDHAFLIDADPEAARARKPEYPLDFLRSNRAAYLALNQLSRHLTVVAPASIEAMQLLLMKEVSQSICPSGAPPEKIFLEPRQMANPSNVP